MDPCVVVSFLKKFCFEARLLTILPGSCPLTSCPKFGGHLRASHPWSITEKVKTDKITDWGPEIKVPNKDKYKVYLTRQLQNHRI